ncbi:helix-turn-helix domain-containing protein [Xenorhabdus sp. XENO-10]|uniref:Helix-turn-helix domain-containing protein n=1 Tax=Xenorhabdus yunnanensis TaxID=3025878 RepID=A0ABT5LEJ4_9GAMM|nr:helix-turn-helix domain-containing protein [Xenorhabdus yunnanensis]MDC9589527.1 helix-turn-helix domain-containing protein [Xenorhabdus yunnanensis]
MKNKNNVNNNSDPKALFPDLRFLAENRKILAEKIIAAKELDWSPDQVRHILIKQGTTIQELSQRWFNGHKGRLYFALSEPWPKGEWIIASYLGLEPLDIWPSRYCDYDSRYYLKFKGLYGSKGSFYIE